MSFEFQAQLKKLEERHEALISRPNPVDDSFYNGVFTRYENPVVTAAHTPLTWRYDLNPATNPFLQERLPMNAAMNTGAIYFEGKYYLMVRVEGCDRKSFFGLAVSDKPNEGFRFTDYPIVMPETDDPDTNVYDMRLTQHEDGWIYGVFCTERKDPDAPAGDTSSATAQAGIARSKNLIDWERLPDLKSPSPQQRNVVLHPEFVNGKYAFYTRPQDGFISTGKGGGIGWGLSDSMEPAVIDEEIIVDERIYHTIKEVKNGAGAAPIKTDAGWLHFAHGVRNCAAGLRYVLYAFLCDLKEPWKVLRCPSGYLLAPIKEERFGDVSNVLFTNGVIFRPETGEVNLYYASSDMRCHVATSTVERVVDYVLNTPEDPLRSYACVQQRRELVAKNFEFLGK